jgi:hypothetical protein
MAAGGRTATLNGQPLAAECIASSARPSGDDVQASFVSYPPLWYLYGSNLEHDPLGEITARRIPTMSDLIAVVLDSREQAQEARLEFMKMQREHLVELEDCVVAYKDDTGQVKLDQTLNLTATGGAAGGFWELFLGLLLAIPFGGLLWPIITAVLCQS